MFCEKCGNKLPNGTHLCTSCGTPQNGGKFSIEYYPPSPPQPPSRKDGIMVFILIALVVIVVGGIMTKPQSKSIEDHTEDARSSRYEFIRADVNWSEANAECMKRGGHLITITSDAEMKIAVDLAEAEGVKYVWMGGFTSVRNGIATGHWLTGELFDYQKWYPGEPSRDDMDETPEMYLMLWNVDSNGWTWNDQRDDLFTPELTDIFGGKTGYICEYES